MMTTAESSGKSSRPPRRLPCWILLATLWAIRPGAAQDSLPKLARGVLTVVPAEVSAADTVSGPLELPELSSVAKAWTPSYYPISDTLHEMAKSITIRRPVWQFEFAAKPMRLTIVDVAGQPQRVWYLVYRLRNTGDNLKPVSKDGGRSFKLERFEQPLRFFPRFVLRDHEHNQEYLDTVIPAAVAKIQRSELRDPRVPLYDAVSISNLSIPVAPDAVDQSIWGVATWTNVDRRADFISVYVQGLTNAYRWNDPPPGKKGNRECLFKTLQLNFWRAGDEVHEHSGEFRVGLPTFAEGPEWDRVLKLYGVEQRSEYNWVFRP